MLLLLLLLMLVAPQYRETRSATLQQVSQCVRHEHEALTVMEVMMVMMILAMIMMMTMTIVMMTAMKCRVSCEGLCVGLGGGGVKPSARSCRRYEQEQQPAARVNGRGACSTTRLQLGVAQGCARGRGSLGA